MGLLFGCLVSWFLFSIFIWSYFSLNDLLFFSKTNSILFKSLIWPLLKINETIQDIIFFQLFNLSKIGWLSCVGGFIKTTVEARLLWYPLEWTINITGSHFGIIFSLFYRQFPFKLWILVLNPLTQNFRLFLFETVFRNNFLQIANFFLIKCLFIFQVINLNW